MSIADQIIQVESGGDPNASNPYSSAGGLGQFTDKTWLDTIRQHRPDLFQQYSPQELLSMKSDPRLSRDMTDALASDNSEFLRTRGLPVNPGTVYLAHFAGAEGASKLLGADDATPVSEVLSPGAITANPFLRNMTVGDLKAWSAKKMGDLPPAAQTTLMQPNSQPQNAIEDGASAGGMNYPPSQVSAPQQNSGQASPNLGAVASIIQALDAQRQPQPIEPMKFITPPGIARARALARAMLRNPIG